MNKIFKVANKTNVEKEISVLIKTGNQYIPEFEKNIGIVDFCDDLEIIADSLIEPNIYLVIAGFSEGTVFKNDALLEVSEEHLKSYVSTGYSIKNIGSNRLLTHLGFEQKVFHEGINSLKPTGFCETK